MLVVIALLVFFAVLIGLFATAAKSAETDQVSPVDNDSTIMEKAPVIEHGLPPKDWKPPVAKKVELPPLVDEKKAAGIHKVTFDAVGLSSGA